MNIDDILKISASIIASLGSGTVIVFAFSNWLGKVWANRILEKDRIKYAAQIETLKSELNKSIHKHNVAVSRIDTQRATAIQELYAALIVYFEVSLQIRAPNKKLLDDKRLAIKNYQVWAEELYSESEKFARLLMRVAIYLQVETYDIIARCGKTIGNLSIEFGDAIFNSNESDIEKLFEIIDNARLEFENECQSAFDPAIKILVEEFRGIMDPTVTIKNC